MPDIFNLSNLSDIIVSDLAAQLPLDIGPGASIAFAKDTKRHYMFSEGVWYIIPNQAEMQTASLKAYVSGTLKTGAFPLLVKATTNSSGVATMYLTDNGLSSGNAVFTEVFTDGLLPVPVGASSNYQVTGTTVSGDKKTLTVNVNQLGSVVLGLINVTTAASGVEVRALVIGR